MNTLKQVLRWIAVLPGGVLAGFFIMFPIHWLALAIHISGGPFYGFITREGGGNPVSLKQLEFSMNSLFVSATIILTSAVIAPKYRFGTAIALAAIIFSSSVALLFAAKNFGLQTVGSTFETALHIILVLFGIIQALLIARELDEEKS